MRSIRNLVADKINEVRDMLKVWDDPNSSPKEKGKVLAELVGTDPAIWQQIAVVASRKPVVKTVVQPTTPAKPAVSQKPASTPATPPPSPKPVPTIQLAGTAPARVLKPTNKTAAQHLMEWLGFLTKFVAGEDINPILTCNKTAEVFSHEENRKMTRDLWTLFFKALTKADEIGGVFHLIDAKAEPAKVFLAAPLDMVSEYCFGKDGLATKIAISLNEQSVGKFPRWLVNKTGIFLDSVWALTESAQLDPHQIGVVENILNRLEKAGAPDGLVKDGREILARQTNTTARVDPTWKGDGRMKVIKEIAS